MDSFDKDTIAALSTPWGRGGIAVIRISGEKTEPILKKIIKPSPKTITPGKTYHSFITDSSKRIDECVMVFFKAPHSYTGEDVAEISIHSNPFLVEEVLNLIYKTGKKGTRTALPGEFTYRAFKNGKLDLLQAESVNELINANSRYFAHMKFGTLEGKLSRFMEELKEELINLGVCIETKIEFEEDQFFDEIAVSNQLQAPLKRLDTLLSNARFNELLNKGLNVVILGKVNVGKSSLFNTLLMEDRSIISSIPGTTRDFIREKIYIDGFPIELTDLAGINRETRDDIEAQGIQRSREKVKHSDAVIFMLDASSPLDHNDKEIYYLIKKKKKLVVVNKLDIKEQTVLDAIAAYFKDEAIVHISVKEHTNIEAVTGFFKEFISDIKDKETDFTINQRQKLALEELKAILTRVKEMAAAHSNHVEIMAEEIRRAVEIIGQLMGEITPDDILNKIFSQFCVGK
ncbi:MAG: tRNA uridine-5-carboxymethylaminomethyl(34) synthesis GTPase MnmE [Candidatus Aminicenantes bacterium]|nr:MAG: tRNA uridine-5-carboxymethylaminomethyl(34) synthesis GTPase MnmE [Candidatus Aminicenantes bacterium]